MLGKGHYYEARLVANYLLQMAEGDDRAIVPDQLIKLVYLCHGWMLGLIHRPLIGEDVEAWRVGPVIRRLHEEIGDGSQPVVRWMAPPPAADFAADEVCIIHQVYAQYAGFDPVRLAARTLTRGTPWDKTWRRHGPEAVIGKALIEDHFIELARGGGGRVVVRTDPETLKDYRD